jgi:hypothetical protein
MFSFTADDRYLLSACGLLLSFVVHIWIGHLMGRDVNRARPFGVIPFESVMFSHRAFELIRLHRQLFPKSWLPELLGVATLTLILSVMGLKR